MKRTPRTPTEREILLGQAAELSNAEARHLVSSYYAAQDMRKRLDLQLRHLVGDGVGSENNPDFKPTPRLLKLASDQFVQIENTMAKGLTIFAEHSQIGRWCMSHRGVAGVITAGLLAHLDITKAPTAGHFWSFAGLNPAQKWEAGEKRPHNADLKQVCYHLGECFKRESKHPDAFYGHLYRSRKKLLIERNTAGAFAERAKKFTTKSKVVKRLLKRGKLPPLNLDRQACNFAAKIFLSHLHAIMYWDHHHQAPAKPFGIAILGHAHEVRVPHTEMFPGFAAAYYGGGEIRREAAE